jgi:hypothetical protein
VAVTTVFVKLLDEGVDVWRPVEATPLGDGRYRLVQPDEYDPATESWEFAPGSVVECETLLISGSPTIVATRLR